MLNMSRLLFLLLFIFLSACFHQYLEQDVHEELYNYSNFKNEPCSKYVYIYPFPPNGLYKNCLNNYAALSDKDKKILQFELVKEYNKLPHLPIVPDNSGFANELFHHHVVWKRFQEVGLDKYIFSVSEEEFHEKTKTEIEDDKSFAFLFIITPALVMDILERIPTLEGNEKVFWQKGMLNIMVYADYGESGPYRLVRSHLITDKMLSDVGILKYGGGIPHYKLMD